MLQQDDMKRTEEVVNIFLPLLCGLVDSGNELSVLPVPTDELRTTLQVRCAAGDVKKLIGIQGRMARALRTVLLGFARDGSFYDLDIAKSESIVLASGQGKQLLIAPRVR